VLAGLPAARCVAELPVLLLTSEAETARAADRPACDLWLAAAAGWESLGEPYPRAQCLLRGVEAALAERRPRPTVAPWLSVAHEIAVRLDAAPLVGALESIARRGRVTFVRDDVQPPGPVSDAVPLGLTPRELQVLRLVGQGYTNGEIADSLFISPKTAGAHVSNILGKLGVGRRVEAAAIAERLDLLDEGSPSRAGG
jgi:DNA-binding CsgD family transcriptional regulator